MANQHIHKLLQTMVETGDGLIEIAQTIFEITHTVPHKNIEQRVFTSLADSIKSKQ